MCYNIIVFILLHEIFFKSLLNRTVQCFPLNYSFHSDTVGYNDLWKHVSAVNTGIGEHTEKVGLLCKSWIIKQCHVRSCFWLSLCSSWSCDFSGVRKWEAGGPPFVGQSGKWFEWTLEGNIYRWRIGEIWCRVWTNNNKVNKELGIRAVIWNQIP